MQPVAPSPDQVCGRCSKYELSPSDADYGYCKPSLAYEAERNRIGAAHARLVHVSTPCFMVADGRPAFVAKEPT